MEGNQVLSTGLSISCDCRCFPTHLRGSRVNNSQRTFSLVLDQVNLGMELSADLSSLAPLDPVLAGTPIRLAYEQPYILPKHLEGRFTQDQWTTMMIGLLNNTTVGTLWQTYSDCIDLLFVQRDTLAQHGSINDRLTQVLAKEEVLRDLLEKNQKVVHDLVEKEETSGNLIPAAEAAKLLDLSPRTLRYYSEQGLIPCYKIGKHRKYRKTEIIDALEKGRREGKIAHSAEVRRRIIR